MTESAGATVDVIVPVHDASRPVARAVNSVFSPNSTANVRVTVVCHNVDPQLIAAALGAELAARVTLLELADGIPSPAGPKNLGLAAAHGEFVVFLDSDDTLQPGAIDSWVSMAETHQLAAVIARERFAHGATIRTPPTRPGRSARLSPVRDRLTYRTAPLGLLRRSVLVRHDLVFTPGLRTGEDQLLSSRLWFSGEPIAFDRRGPSYLVGDDATGRVTMEHREVADELRAVDELVADPWFAGLPIAARRSIVTRIVRVHVFGAALSRSDPDRWTAPDRAFLSAMLGRFSIAAPRFETVLSVADRRLLDALSSGDSSARLIGELARARRRFGRPSTVITRNLRGLFAVDGPLRFMVASLAV